MEIENKIFYSELPSRNVYIDSVVNALPGYYPARSEFTIEYKNEVEQDLTNVCFLYDQIVNNGGEPEQSDDEEEEEDHLKNLLSLVKKEPTDDHTQEEDDKEDSVKIDLSLVKNEPTDENTKEECQQSNINITNTSRRSSRKRKCKSQDDLEICSTKYSSKRKKINLDAGKTCDGIKKEPVSDQEEEGPNSIKVNEDFDKQEELKEKVNRNTQVTQEDRNVLEQLCLASIDIYNNRLRERNDRKEFVRNHGFLDQKKIYSWYNIHNLELGDGLFNVFLKKFIKLFDNAYEFDKFIQQLKLERECRNKLIYLDELRANGIRHKKMIPLYNKLKDNRNKLHEEIKHLDISDIVNMASLSALETSEVTKSELPKRKSRKLEISHLPNYKCLTEEEKELCSNIRLTPESYLNFKEIMIDECKKVGGLRLAQARPLFKIDVNKTRQVYDHLIDQKLIWKG